MVHAMRYANDNTMTARNAYRAFCEQNLAEAYQVKLAEEKAQREAFEEAQYLERYFGSSSRTRFLMEEKGMSLLDACRQAEAEERQWEEDTAAWLADPANRDSEIYSDVFKDLYGFRPRF